MKKSILLIFALMLIIQPNITFAQAAKFHVDVGVNYLNKNQYIEAYQEFQKALNKDPNCAEAYYNLGMVYKAQGSKQEAIIEFQNALRVKPDYIEAKRELASWGVSYKAQTQTPTQTPTPTQTQTQTQTKNVTQTQTQTNTKTETPKQKKESDNETEQFVKKLIEERSKIKQSNITVSANAYEVSNNPNTYMNKMIEWDGNVESIYKAKEGMLVLVNTNPKVNPKNNMDYCYVIVLPEFTEEDRHRISNNASISVKGKIIAVERIFYLNIGYSKRKQPFILPTKIEFRRDEFDSSPLTFQF